MSNLEGRLKRLEETTRANREERFVYILPNLEEEEDEETPYRVKVSSKLWAHAIRGGPFTDEEIQSLRQKYGEEGLESRRGSKNE
jgi:hypothetical protein